MCVMMWLAVTEVSWKLRIVYFLSIEFCNLLWLLLLVIPKLEWNFPLHFLELLSFSSEVPLKHSNECRSSLVHTQNVLVFLGHGFAPHGFWPLVCSFQKRGSSVAVAPVWCSAADTAQSINEDAQIPSPAVSTSSSNTWSWRAVPKPAAISESTLNTAARELHLQCKYENTKFLQNTLQIRLTGWDKHDDSWAVWPLIFYLFRPFYILGNFQLRLWAFFQSKCKLLCLL